MPTHTEEFLRAAAEARTRIQEVSPAEVRPLVDEGAMLLDVREKDEFDNGHINGATHCPRAQLESDIATLVSDKEAPIVCYCGGGNRGALAADALQQLGYKHVYSIAGGLIEYKKSGR